MAFGENMLSSLARSFFPLRKQGMTIITIRERVKIVLTYFRLYLFMSLCQDKTVQRSLTQLSEKAMPHRTVQNPMRQSARRAGRTTVRCKQTAAFTAPIPLGREQPKVRDGEGLFGVLRIVPPFVPKNITLSQQRKTYSHNREKTALKIKLQIKN